MRRTLAAILAALFLCLLPVAVAAQDAPPTPAPAATHKGLLMPDLGPDATQADYGARRCTGWYARHATAMWGRA